MWQVKWELEDLALRYLEPEQYLAIARLLDERREERERYIREVIAILERTFAEADIRAEITGRPKHIYSIWRKMQRKAVDFEQIFDVRAVRVLVDEIADCYAALGVVHGLWKHIPREFDDYIATPKFNLYQSLHTAVIGPEGKPLEMQIRTREMHHHAELGVAAHWRYKESKGHDADFERRIVWMRHWLEMKDEGDGERVPGALQVRARIGPRLCADTPGQGHRAAPGGYCPGFCLCGPHRGRPSLPRGQGQRPYRAAHSGSQSGETVEILTQKNGAPSRDWL